jgi:cytochrome c oxidase subunit 2
LTSHALGPERTARRWTTWATVGSAGLLVALLGADMWTDRALSRLPAADALRIEMTAQQWWWEARYLDAQGKPEFAVSSELHVPVGRPVIVTLKSTDVIHTFWVPSLHGKKDMLPGRSTQLLLRADKPGTYRGECAEFCGLQHALMAFSVSADPPEAYAQWRAGQQLPAAEPSGRTRCGAGSCFSRPTARSATRCAAPRPWARWAPTSRTWEAARCSRPAPWRTSRRSSPPGSSTPSP